MTGLSSRGGGRGGGRGLLPVLAGLPRVAEAYGPTWRVRMVELLHLVTSLALALFYLVPACLLVVSATWVGFAVTLPWLPDTPDRGLGGLAVDALLMLVASPVAASLLARLACRVQRERLGAVFGIVETSPPDPLPGDGPVVRAWRFVFGRDAWSMIVYSTVAGLHGLVAGGLVMFLVVCGGAAAVGALFGIMFVLAQGAPEDIAGPLALVAVGPLLALVGLRLTPSLVATEVLLHRMLLFEAPELRIRRRLVHVQDSRLRMVDAAEAERRRIERDLHDGAQQRLTALVVRLRMASSRFDDDPEQARLLVEQAHADARAALVELRELVHGIHPAALTERGLVAALEELADTQQVEVAVEAGDVGRLPDAVESTAYFCAAEAVANAARHSGADTVRVGRRVNGGARRGTLLLT
ncbi:histidine kinase, partial [Nocardiopsis tropica]|nr:histidine kinase [Nocardiopsis tropica]